MSDIVPKIIFIVPYRDREEELSIFRNGMQHLQNVYKDDVQLMIIHQCDSRDFNRGAMKNIGFQVVKKIYPTTYNDITLVFNDVDIAPTSDCKINYQTQIGIVKHFYGYKHTLGGIVSIYAGYFESIIGFPFFWTWGYEDKVLQKRIEKKNLLIDRSEFLEINQKEETIQTEKFILTPGNHVRKISKEEALYSVQDIAIGLNDLRNVEYNISDNDFVNVTSFQTSNKIPEIQKEYIRGNNQNIEQILGIGRRGRRGRRGGRWRKII